MQRTKLLVKITLVLAIAFIGLSETPAEAWGCSPVNPTACQSCWAWNFCWTAEPFDYCRCHIKIKDEYIVLCGDCPPPAM